MLGVNETAMLPAQIHRHRASCISACLLGAFSALLMRICLVGRLRCSPLHTSVGLDFAYSPGETDLSVRAR